MSFSRSPSNRCIQFSGDSSPNSSSRIALAFCWLRKRACRDLKCPLMTDNEKTNAPDVRQRADRGQALTHSHIHCTRVDQISSVLHSRDEQRQRVQCIGCGWETRFTGEGIYTWNAHSALVMTDTVPQCHTYGLDFL